MSLRPHWSYNYIGLSGVSCSGLLNLVYREELKVDLADYGKDVSSSELDEMLALSQGIDTRPWTEISAEMAHEWDVVTFRMRGLDSHLGIIIGRGCMLHVSKEILSRIERFDVEPWSSLSPRFYRYDPKQKQIAALHKVATTSSPLVLPTLDRVDITCTVPEGSTILEAVRFVFPGITENAFENIRVTIGNHRVSPEYWGRVRPKRWDVVIIRVVPGISGLLRIVLTIAVLVGAAAISGGALGPLAATVGLAGGWLGAGTVSASILGAVVGIGGSLLINALFPVRKAQDAWWDKLPVYNISGFSNSLNADGTVPSVLGQVRFAPPFAALPFNFNYAGLRYAVAVFLVGYGPVQISDIMIGLTPITDFQGVEVEIRQGFADDPPLTLYPTQVIEDSDNPLDLPARIGGQRRITAVNTTAIELEWYFGSGLIAYDQNANPQVMGVHFIIQYRLLGTSTWIGDAFQTFNETTRSFWTSYRIDLPSMGQYEVIVTRDSPDWDDVTIPNSPIRYVTRSTWSALRSFRPAYPLNYRKPMALIALRIQASAQLGGTIQGVSCMARRICTFYNVFTRAWDFGLTSNPASLYRYVHEGPENAFPRDDSQLDVADIEEWASYCAFYGLEYNAVHQADESQDTVLEAVAAAGHALPHDRGDKWSVIVDRPRAVFAGHITPVNSAGFTHVNPKVDFPDAFIVSFADERNYYNPTKRVVPWPGHTGEIVVSQEISLPGKTNPDEVWKETRRRQYEAMLRQDSYTVEQDIEQLGYARGDAVIVSHPVLNKRQTAGYVISASSDGLLITFDGLVVMQSGISYQVRVRRNDGSAFVGFVAPFIGETSQIVLSSATGIAVPGDLVMIGEEANVEQECIIKSIQPGDNYTATLNLVAHAPELDILSQEDTPPVWDGIIGNAADYGTGVPPGVPSITSAASGGYVDQLASSLNPHPVAVFVVSNPGDVPPAQTLQVRYKLTASLTWVTGPVFLANAIYFLIPGFNIGDSVDIQARAIRSGLDSAWSATTTIQNGANLAPWWVPQEKALADLYIDFLQVTTNGIDYGMAWMQKQNIEVPVSQLLTFVNGASIDMGGNGLLLNGTNQYAAFSNRSWITVAQPGTLFVEYIADVIDGSVRVMIDMVNTNCREFIYLNGNIPVAELRNTGGSTYFVESGAAQGTGVVHSDCLTWDATHAGATFRTVPAPRTTFAAQSLAVPSAVQLGALVGAGGNFGGKIRRVAYFQNLFSDAQMSALGGSF